MPALLLQTFYRVHILTYPSELICVFELYTEDPTNFLCKLCNVKQTAMLPALSHAQECGKKFCDMFYKSTTPTIVTPIQVTLVEPVSIPFILPSADPFPPDHFELSIHGELTSRFIEQVPYLLWYRPLQTCFKHSIRTMGFSL